MRPLSPQLDPPFVAAFVRLVFKVCLSDFSNKSLFVNSVLDCFMPPLPLYVKRKNPNKMLFMLHVVPVSFGWPELPGMKVTKR